MTDNYQPINGRNEYETALRQLLAMAEQEIRVFDPDLSNGGWQRKDVAELLQSFLARGRNNSLTLILHDKNFVQQHCPRLLPLLQMHAHKVRLLLTTADAQHLRDSFVLVDKLHSLRRFHQDHDRAALELHAKETANILQQRFAELLEASNPDTLSPPLGL